MSTADEYHKPPRHKLEPTDEKNKQRKREKKKKKKKKKL
jgi:hypothetical protein